MPNQQKYRPISFRPPEADRLRLMALAAKTGQAVNAIIARALSEYLDHHDTSPVEAATKEGQQ